jgi:hypothetical protein
MEPFMRTWFIIAASLLTTFPSFAQTDDEEEGGWKFSTGVRYMNRFTRYGIDLSASQPAIAPTMGLRHKSGLSAGLEGIFGAGSETGLQRWSASLGYEHEFAEWIAASVEYTRLRYTNDTLNVLAGLSNAISISADVDFDDITISANFDSYLGSLGATYFGIDVSGLYEFGDVFIVPLAQVTFVSQTVSLSRLTTPGRGKHAPANGGGAVSTATLTGLSSASIHAVLLYPVTSSLRATFHSALLYTPQQEISTTSLQIIWSIGVRYSLSL